MATLGNLGQIAEVFIGGNDRPRTDNDLFGAFGRDFVTRDGRRLMIVAITAKQWKGLLRALDIQEQISNLEAELGLSFATDEGVRFEHRDRLNPIVSAAVARRDFGELTSAFDAAGVCWGPYRTLKAALDQDERLSPLNPVFSEVQHPSGHRYLTPGYAGTMTGHSRQTPACAPQLGEHTEQVLAEVLRLTDGEIADLHDRRIVAGPAQ
jgi:2-methylfumaryl-CoA isomerase